MSEHSLDHYKKSHPWGVIELGGTDDSILLAHTQRWFKTRRAAREYARASGVYAFIIGNVQVNK